LLTSAHAQGTVVLTAQAAATNNNGYWRDANGTRVRDGSNQCVRAGYFTNDMASPDCPAPAAVVLQPTPQIPVPAPAPGSAYWKDNSGTVVRSGSGQCVRAGFFSKELATADCDPDLVPKPVAAPAPPPAPAPVVVAPAPSAAPAPAVAPARIPEVVPAPRIVTFKADTFFDFDKSAVKPEGRAALRSLVDQAKGATVEQVRIEGHTDSTGPAKYNIGLSVRRAEAVKRLLVQEGIPADKVVTEGLGESQPVASNATRDGRAQNRRVEVELVGSRIAK
jgi:OOP family OmpA-OmpF porin